MINTVFVSFSRAVIPAEKKGDCLRNPVTAIKYTVNNITGSKDKGQSSTDKEKKKTQLVKLVSAAFLPSKWENCKNGKFKINMPWSCEAYRQNGEPSNSRFFSSHRAVFFSFFFFLANATEGTVLLYKTWQFYYCLTCKDMTLLKHECFAETVTKPQWYSSVTTRQCKQKAI